MNNDNFLTIEQEMQWLEGCLNRAFRHDLNQFIEYPPAMLSAEPPTINGISTLYAQFIEKNKLSIEDRLLLALAVLPHFQPTLLAKFRRISERNPIAGSLIKSASFDYWLPSGLTYVYLYANKDDEKRYEIIKYLHSHSQLISNGVVGIEPHLTGEPALSGVISLQHSYWQLLTENSTELDLLTFSTSETYA